MNVLITGEKGYIGIKLGQYLSQFEEKYHVSYLSVRTDDWRNCDFSQYHVVIHTAAIVHLHEEERNKNLYYKVNRDLTIELATRAKESGVAQFIFLSTISVYGIDGQIGVNTVIKNDTPCVPKTLYGKSKLEAEKALTKLEDEDFVISIIRPPMVYGPKCPGNYSKLSNLIKIMPIFLEISNSRSMIYIDNLIESIKLILDEKISGMFHPQNMEYVTTVKMAELIARYNNKKLKFFRIPAFFLRVLGKENKILLKLFGNLVIDKDLSVIRGHNYCVSSFEDSIKQTESK